MNKGDKKRNTYKLDNHLKKQGYDWWWHHFTGYHAITGEEKTFYVEYYFINPALSPDQVVLAQEPLAKVEHTDIKPSYFMVHVGTWGKNKKQLHNYYPTESVLINKNPLRILLNDIEMTETYISGSCIVSLEDASNPKYMSDSGTMSWSLTVEKEIAYNVGYGASKIMQKLDAFEMYWHAEGIKANYKGSVIIDGETYIVTPETSYGYADKNWGKNYTSPWLWLSSCDLYSRKSNKRLSNSAIEFGGGRPKVFSIGLKNKILGGIFYEGEMIEFNFSKFWKSSQIDYRFQETDKEAIWYIKGQNKKYKIKLKLVCPLVDMIEINYEAPDGTKKHNHLLNGGTGKGFLKIYTQEDRLIDIIDFYHTGCEYGEFD